MLKKYEFILEGLDCANCANKIQNKLAENKDYKNVNVNFNTLKLTLESEKDDVKGNVKAVVKSLEPEVEVLELHTNHYKHDDAENHNHYNYNGNRLIEEKNINFIRIIIGIILMVIVLTINIPENIKYILLIFAYFILLFRTAKNSIKLLKNKVIDENFLVTISCIGAFLIGESLEGLMVIILFEIGKLLEEKAIYNTRKSISDLMDIRPKYANLKHENHEHKVLPEEVNIGNIIIVKQGEKVPLDGVVVEGIAGLSTSSLTGESKLQYVKEGDTVLSGSINEKGLIELKVTEKYEDSTVSKILNLVENATDKKAKIETFVNKASRIYTPIVLILSLIVAIVLPFISNITYIESIYRGLIFLVISCPCAIVISVPLSYFSGIGKASKKGILIKGSNYLDAIKDIKYIAFDKTGTLTKGKFEIEEIKVYDKKYSKEQILEFAAFGERFSNHPLSNCILEKYGKDVDKDIISDFEEIPGKGLIYKIDNKVIKIGNSELTESKEENDVGTNIYVKIENTVIGAIILKDSIKSEAKNAINSLNKLGIKTVMFTGDNLEIAKDVAEKIGIKEIKAEMLPQEKYIEIEKVIKSKIKGNVSFVGDGINDAPVLALSDIGISMGGIGSSSAIEASDVVIMTDDLSKIFEAINISKQTNKIIKQNLIFALGVKIMVLILSVIGLSQMWMAVFADVGVTLITILNTLRLLKSKTDIKI